MTSEDLYESARRGELILIDGGFCRFRVRRRDGQLTILEIVSTRKGAGHEMMERLKAMPGVTGILAKCFRDLDTMKWWERQGFIRTGLEFTKAQREVNVWRWSRDGKY